jgi:hypothetical protein
MSSQSHYNTVSFRNPTRSATFESGNLIKYKCRGEWGLARVTKVNKRSIRIEDGVFGVNGDFVASGVRNPTNKGTLQTQVRTIYKFLRETGEPIVVLPIPEKVVPAAPKSVKKSTPAIITIHHPRKGPLVNSLRIGDFGKIRSTGRQAGCSGYSIETVRTSLAEWQSDGIRYNKMKFGSSASNPKALRFIKSTENPDNFQTLVIGKERECGIGKAAFINVTTNRIVLRTATSEPTARKSYDTHSANWRVETGLFNADKGFWKRLKKHGILDEGVVSPVPLVDYPVSDDDEDESE